MNNVQFKNSRRNKTLLTNDDDNTRHEIKERLRNIICTNASIVTPPHCLRHVLKSHCNKSVHVNMLEPSNQVRIQFDDFVDFSTRLVLLPRIEEEGTGAVVAMYTPKEQNEDTGESREAVETTEKEKGASPEPAGESIDDDEENSSADINPSVSENKEQPKADKQELPEENPEISVHDLVDKKPEAEAEKESNADTENGSSRHEIIDEKTILGMTLTGIEIDKSDPNHLEDCIGKDFTLILSTIREAPVPIVLVLQKLDREDSEHPDQEVSKEKEKCPEDDASTSTSATPEECDVGSVSLSKVKGGGSEWSDRFSSWGSKVRATSATLAAEAASSAASLAAAANEAAERAKANRQAAALLDNALKNAERAASETSRCSMFVQCSAGKFVPLQTLSTSSSSSINSNNNPKVTTSSVLLIRESVKEPCPSRGFSFQWYRSYRRPCSTDVSVSEICSKDGSMDGSNDETAEDASLVSESCLEWTSLPGAVYAAYQPSATDIGHYLRCVVTIDTVDGRQHDSDDDSHDEDEEDTVICSTHCIVAADMALFSGATQALTRGAKFGNIAGRGNAEGRMFRVHIEIAREISDDSSSKAGTTSAVTIFQISGNTAEPLHDEPIQNVTAISDPSRPKDFELIMSGANTLPPMVLALSENGRFQLQAPNRITRESLLLALGIANFKGKPIKLNTKTALYPGRLDEVSVSMTANEVDTPSKRLVGEEVQFFTPQETSFPASPVGVEVDAISSERTKLVEQEFQRLRSKMSRKDKVIADLQRQLTQSDAKVERMERALSAGHAAAEARKKEIQECRSLLRLADRRNDAHNDTVKRMKGDHAKHVASLEERVTSQSETISELEKTVRTLQNEKAVLSAAVEARDSKLAKMSDLQTAVDSLSQKVSKGDSLKVELNEMSQRYIEINQEMEKVSKFEKECREELNETRSKMEELQKRLVQEKERGGSRQAEFDALQAKNQKLQAERNSYKQKAESLSKEVGRLCRNGRTLRDIEKIVADEEARQMEVSLLKQQKRQALEDLHHYRTAYEQTVVAQKQAGLDVEAVRAVEQKAELERVIADMTEYVNAKEMQLETMKQVNQALSEELHLLARANMSKNDI